MSLLQPGDVVYVDYGENPTVIHSRLVLAEVDRSQHEFMILTPDQDVYCEILHQSNPDYVGFYLSGATSWRPSCPDLRLQANDCFGAFKLSADGKGRS